MLRLDSTLRKIQILLSGIITTSQLPVMVMYSDRTATAYSGAAQLANTNSTTAVDICAAPAASTVRDIDYISVRNSDTVAATATIRYNDNATLYTIVTVTLAVGDQLVYVHGDGWRTVDSSGHTKTLFSALTGGVTTVGNVATVITNANLTGHVTSVGNAAVLGSFTIGQLNTAISDADAATDSLVVHLAGTETIAGAKTFTTGVVLGAGSAVINATHLLSIGNTASNSFFNLGQAFDRSFEVGWIYNATPENAYGQLVTYGYGNDFRMNVKTLMMQSHASAGNALIGTITDASTGKLQVNGTIYATGLRLDYTNTATVGAVTINKASGRVNIAAAGTSVVVTNSLVTAASHVMVVASTNDATARVTSVVPAAGSFTINTVATTAETSFDFVVFNAD